MPSPRRRPAGFLVATALLLSCGTPVHDAPPASHPPVHAAYVLLAAAPDGAPQAQARLVVDGDATSCPELTGGEAPLPMTFRLNPHGFAVKVCEAVVPFGRRLAVSWTGQALPVAKKDPSHLLVLGDTGCKSADCAEGEASPFATLAAAAAGKHPDLVLHAGDYDYRGTGGFDYGPEKLPMYDAGDVGPDDGRCQLDGPYVSQNAGYSDRPDRWEDWRLDFFEPAAELLAAAPFVFARGNHELCSRAGPGWFYFLDPSAEPEAGGDGQLACPPQGEDAPPPGGALPHLVLRAPYTVDLGSFRVAVLDSANACDGYAPEETTAVYGEQLATLLAGVPRGATTWMLTHRPIWGVDGQAEDGGWQTLSQTLQQGLHRATAEVPGGGLPAGLRLVVAGHMHQFLSVTFPDDAARPPQLVVGDSGVALYTPDPSGTFSPTVDGLAANALAFSHFGFLDVPQLAADGGWRGTLLGPAAGGRWAECDTAGLPQTLCVATTAE